MATPFQKLSTNGGVNVRVSAEEADIRHERFYSTFAARDSQITLMDVESNIYRKWLILPHPDIHLNAHLARIRREAWHLILIPTRRSWKWKLLKSFRLNSGSYYAEIADVWTAYDIIWEFKEKIQKIGAVLEVELEDELADFNAEDFKRVEKEDDKAREKAKARQEASSRA